MIRTAECITPKHPDKICDRISDAVVDLMLEKYPEARVACETMVSTNRTIIAGEYRLPEGINIEYADDVGRWRYTTSITQADGSKKRMRLPMLKASDLEADENLKKIVQAKTKGKEVFDLALKIAGKTILTTEKFY